MAISTSRRMEQIKQYVTYGILLLILATFILLITPLGPNMYLARIRRENTVGEPVKPGATESMYKLGRFYQMTMRSDDAKGIYEELVDKWYFENRKSMNIDEDDVWVGLAMYWLGDILWDTGFKQQARERWEDFLNLYDGVPGMDAETIENARVRAIRR